MPMHLWIDARGVIRAAGPTLAKLWPEPLAGLDFFEVFELRKPQDVAGAGDLAALAGCGPDFLYDLERGKPTVRLDKLVPVLGALGLTFALAPRAPALGADRTGPRDRAGRRGRDRPSRGPTTCAASSTTHKRCRRAMSSRLDISQATPA